MQKISYYLLITKVNYISLIKPSINYTDTLGMFRIISNKFWCAKMQAIQNLKELPLVFIRTSMMSLKENSKT